VTLMEGLLIAFGVGIAAWWGSTGALFCLLHQGRPGPRISAALALALAVGGVCLITATAAGQDAASAYWGFAGALLVWAGIELSFLVGLIIGPNQRPCPPDLRGWGRFVAAARTLLHHEVLILSGLALVFVLAPPWQNPTAVQTFAVLAGMRLSAKLNVFLGAPNLSEELMPAPLAHLRSYFRRAAFNLLFPVSMMLGAMAASLAAAQALSAPAASAAAAAGALSFAFLILGLAEHLLMMTPLDDAALWRWALPRSRSRAPSAPHPSTTVFQPEFPIGAPR
jgi:putative photosynthetic complex assembly protein 2